MKLVKKPEACSDFGDSEIRWFETNATTGALINLGFVKNGINGVDGILNCYSLALSRDGRKALHRSPHGICEFGAVLA